MRAGWVVVVCCGMRRSEDGGEGEGNYIDVREASKFH